LLLVPQKQLKPLQLLTLKNIIDEHIVYNFNASNYLLIIQKDPLFYSCFIYFKR
jgi:hypothetical protein